MLHRTFKGEVWDFETSDDYIYGCFLTILKHFQIIPLEEYAVPYDSCSCRFCCTKRQRIQIEYIFRRFIGLEERYLLDLDSYQNRARLYMEERYAIY